MCHPDPPYQYLGLRIKFLHHAFNHKIMACARAEGLDELTIMHGRILGYLYRNPERDVFQRDLEDHFNISRSSVAGIVKLMEQKGYIRREGVREDARLKTLTLTDQGLDACRQAMTVFHRVEAEAVQGLSPAQLNTFLDVCDAIQENLTHAKECAHAENDPVPRQGV